MSTARQVRHPREPRRSVGSGRGAASDGGSRGVDGSTSGLARGLLLVRGVVRCTTPESPRRTGARTHEPASDAARRGVFWREQNTGVGGVWHASCVGVDGSTYARGVPGPSRTAEQRQNRPDTHTGHVGRGLSGCGGCCCSVFWHTRGRGFASPGPGVRVRSRSARRGERNTAGGAAGGLACCGAARQPCAHACAPAPTGGNARERPCACGRGVVCSGCAQPQTHSGADLAP